MRVLSKLNLFPEIGTLIIQFSQELKGKMTCRRIVYSYSCLYTRCDNGLVMWLPLEWPSEREANGMIMARGSNKLHQELVTNGSLSAGVSDQDRKWRKHKTPQPF